MAWQHAGEPIGTRLYRAYAAVFLNLNDGRALHDRCRSGGHYLGDVIRIRRLLGLNATGICYQSNGNEQNVSKHSSPSESASAGNTRGKWVSPASAGRT